MVYRNGNKKNILVRLEESKADYLTENLVKKNGYLFLDSLVRSIHDLANIVVICRYSDQVTKVSERYQDKVSVVGNIIDGTSAINSCDLFIGSWRNHDCRGLSHGKACYLYNSYFILRREVFIKKWSAFKSIKAN